LGGPEKRSLVAIERDEEARGAWRARLKGAEDPRRLVCFVDECSTNIALSTRYARAPKGQRARGTIRRNWGKNITLISSITRDGGIGASLSMEGLSEKESLGLFLKEVLCPRLKRGQIVVMDNLSVCVHRGAWVKELIEEKGAEVLLLPPYCRTSTP
jgi:hypothetical protein